VPSGLKISRRIPDLPGPVFRGIWFNHFSSSRSVSRNGSPLFGSIAEIEFSFLSEMIQWSLYQKSTSLPMGILVPIFPAWTDNDAFWRIQHLVVWGLGKYPKEKK
jgi:hypothetical protein